MNETYCDKQQLHELFVFLKELQAIKDDLEALIDVYEGLSDRLKTTCINWSTIDKQDLDVIDVQQIDKLAPKARYDLHLALCGLNYEDLESAHTQIELLIEAADEMLRSLG